MNNHANWNSDNQPMSFENTIKKLRKSRSTIQKSLNEIRDNADSTFERMLKRLKGSKYGKFNPNQMRRKSKSQTRYKQKKKRGFNYHNRSKSASKSLTQRKTPTYRNSYRFHPKKSNFFYSKNLLGRMNFSKVDYSTRLRSPSPVRSRKFRSRSPSPARKLSLKIKKKSLSDIFISQGLSTMTASNYGLTSLDGLEIRRNLKGLYLQNNYLTSFKYLNTQPDLEELNVSNNCLASFCGLKSQPKLKKINVEGNPVCRHPHYRLMCLMCVGSSLKSINNDPVILKERDFVDRYLKINPYALEAVRNGWLMDLKVRSKSQFVQLIRKLKRLDFDDREFLKKSRVYNKLGIVNVKEKEKRYRFNFNSEGKPRSLFRNKRRGRSISRGRSRSKERKSRSKERNFMNENNIIETDSYFENNQDPFNQSSIRKPPKKRFKSVKPYFKKQLSKYNDQQKQLKPIFTMDDLNTVGSLILHGFFVVKRQKFIRISVSFSSNYIEILNSLNHRKIGLILFNDISRTSLVLEKNAIYRLRIQYGDNDENCDILTRDKKTSLSFHKILHIFIERSKKKQELEEKESKQSEFIGDDRIIFNDSYGDFSSSLKSTIGGSFGESKRNDIATKKSFFNPFETNQTQGTINVFSNEKGGTGNIGNFGKKESVVFPANRPVIEKSKEYPSNFIKKEPNVHSHSHRKEDFPVNNVYYSGAVGLNTSKVSHDSHFCVGKHPVEEPKIEKVQVTQPSYSNFMERERVISKIPTYSVQKKTTENPTVLISDGYENSPKQLNKVIPDKIESTIKEKLNEIEMLKIQLQREREEREREREEREREREEREREKRERKRERKEIELQRKIIEQKNQELLKLEQKLKRKNQLKELDEKRKLIALKMKENEEIHRKEIEKKRKQQQEREEKKRKQLQELLERKKRVEIQLQKEEEEKQREKQRIIREKQEKEERERIKQKERERKLKEEQRKLDLERKIEMEEKWRILEEQRIRLQTEKIQMELEEKRKLEEKIRKREEKDRKNKERLIELKKKEKVRKLGKISSKQNETPNIMMEEKTVYKEELPLNNDFNPNIIEEMVEEESVIHKNDIIEENTTKKVPYVEKIEVKETVSQDTNILEEKAKNFDDEIIQDEFLGELENEEIPEMEENVKNKLILRNEDRNVPEIILTKDNGEIEKFLHTSVENEKKEIPDIVLSNENGDVEKLISDENTPIPIEKKKNKKEKVENFDVDEFLDLDDILKDNNIEISPVTPSNEVDDDDIEKEIEAILKNEKKKLSSNTEISQVNSENEKKVNVNENLKDKIPTVFKMKEEEEKHNKVEKKEKMISKVQINNQEIPNDKINIEPIELDLQPIEFDFQSSGVEQIEGNKVSKVAEGTTSQFSSIEKSEEKNEGKKVSKVPKSKDSQDSSEKPVNIEKNKVEIKVDPSIEKKETENEIEVVKEEKKRKKKKKKRKKKKKSTKGSEKVEEKSEEVKKVEKKPKIDERDIFKGTVDGEVSTFQFFDTNFLVNKKTIEFDSITGLDKLEHGVKGEDLYKIIYSVVVEGVVQQWEIGKRNEEFEDYLLKGIQQPPKKKKKKKKKKKSKVVASKPVGPFVKGSINKKEYEIYFENAHLQIGENIINYSHITSLNKTEKPDDQTHEFLVGIGKKKVRVQFTIENSDKFQELMTEKLKATEEVKKERRKKKKQKAKELSAPLKVVEGKKKKVENKPEKKSKKKKKKKKSSEVKKPPKQIEKKNVNTQKGKTEKDSALKKFLGVFIKKKEVKKKK